MRLIKYANPIYLYKDRAWVASRVAAYARRGLGHLGIALLENQRRLAALRNIHAGRRAFVIGNGPSLKVSDLDAIRGEISFAANKIYLAFDQTQWRPDYYFVADKLVAINNRDKIAGLNFPKFYTRSLEGLLPHQPSVYWVDELVGNLSCVKGDPRFPGARDRRGNRIGYFSEDPLKGLNGGSTVIYPMLQLAYFMGFSEVFLLGIDFNFVVPDSVVPTSVGRGYEVAVKSIGEVNHFHPDYRKPGELWSVPSEEVMQAQAISFAAAREAFEISGRALWNASRQTKLEVVPRKNMDDVLRTLGRTAA